MIILIRCIEYSVFIGASVICFDFTKPVKCQVNFKNISQYLSLSLSHTGGVGKNNCTHWCKKGPGWNDPMTAVVPRVKGFAC